MTWTFDDMPPATSATRSTRTQRVSLTSAASGRSDPATCSTTQVESVQGESATPPNGLPGLGIRSHAGNIRHTRRRRDKTQLDTGRGAPGKKQFLTGSATDSDSRISTQEHSRTSSDGLDPLNRVTVNKLEAATVIVFDQQSLTAEYITTR